MKTLPIILAAFISASSFASLCPRVDSKYILVNLPKSELDAAACERRTVKEIYAWLTGYDRCFGVDADETWGKDTADVDEKLRSLTYEEFSRIALPRAKTASEKKFATDYWRAARRFSRMEFSLINSYLGSGYSVTNRLLREEGPGSRCIEPFVAAQTSAIAKFPAYVGIVWRGVTLPSEKRAEYIKDAEITWPSYGSTSLSRKIAESFAGIRTSSNLVTDRSNSVLFKIHSIHCRNTYPFSGMAGSGEQEVLCLPGAKFVVAREPTLQPDGSSLIEMTEVSRRD